MKTIFTDEFKRSAWTVRSILIITIFLLLAFVVGKYSDAIALISNGKSPIVSGLFAGYTLLGTFFSFILYASNLTKDIELESIRYITPYLSRTKIFFGKFLAMITYFSLLFLVSLLLLSVIRKEFLFPIQDVVNLFVFFFYVESLVVTLSVVVKTSKMANFLGVTLGFILPFLGAITYTSSNVLLKGIGFLLPYRYMEGDWQPVFPFLLSCVLLSVGLFIFHKKEL